MKQTLFIFAIVFLAVKCQQCEPHSFLNQQGQCQCKERGKFPQFVKLSLLQETLRSLDNGFSAITAQIPLLYNFTEGEAGYYSIQDGGDDIYDGGNIISMTPNKLTVLAYTGGDLYSNSPLLREDPIKLDSTNFDYYTVKYPGLFVLAADVDIEEFSITGNLGADGEGEADGIVLTKTINDISYKGFVKRVFGAEDPTVNHLIIIEDNGAADHFYSTDTGEDLHVVTGLTGATRLYYVLFATKDPASLANVQVDDATMEDIMTAFIETINPTGTRSKCIGDCPEGCWSCLSATECLECNIHLELTNGMCEYSPCSLDSFLNSQGQCQCTAPGHFLEPLGQDERPSLEETLNSINRNSKLLASHIPSVYEFTEGKYGNSISDGNNDMFDGGNYLSTDLGLATQTFLFYSDQLIATDLILGRNGSYYTAKYPGLFVFAADIDINNFTITGELGADGEGQVDGAILAKTVNGVSYKGFVKRVYGSSDPSVNHLIIIEDNGLADHAYSPDTNNDLHIITGLKGVNRLYYLLFSSYDNSSANPRIDDITIEDLMSSFISTITNVQRCTGACSDRCLACLSATECTQCDAVSQLIEGSCQFPLCEPGSFLNAQGECQCTASGMFLEPAAPKTLNEILNVLNNNFNLVTSQIPSIFYFTEGEQGDSILDGPQDMYDQGNYLATNLAPEDSYLFYTNGVISYDAMLGDNNSYFTAKYPGLFVLAADVDNISEFSISGRLGADGHGNVDGLVLTQTIKGVTYKGFVKRVYGTNDPTVNHLIILEDNRLASHTYSLSTDDDQHIVQGLEGVNRLYYLLFASFDQAPAAKIDDIAMEFIMASFINIISNDRQCTGNCPMGCSSCVSGSQCRECDIDWVLVENICQAL